MTPDEPTQPEQLTWEELIEKLKEEVEKEKETLEEIEERVAKPISIHHKDYHTLVREMLKAIEAAEKDVEKLGKTTKPEESAAEFIDLIDNLKHIDENMLIATVSTIFIMRHIGMYYYEREERLDRLLERADDRLIAEAPEDKKEELRKIKKELQETKDEMKEVIKEIQMATHSVAPQGPIVKAAYTLQKLMETEEVKSWIQRRRRARDAFGGTKSE